MSGYEMAELFIAWVQFLESITERYVTLLFAFLVASYLVSAKLRRPMVVIVLVLYSYMMLRHATMYINLSGDIIALATSITEARMQGGAGLEWLVFGQTGFTANLYSQAVAMVLGFLASVVFFFYMRRHPR